MTTGPLPSFLALSFRNPSMPHLEIESFRLSELRRRMPARFFERVQRPRFHLLALYTDGEGCQEVDFVRLACVPGTLIHVHPGQVLRYLSVERAEAQLVLFTPEFLWPTGQAETDQPSHLSLDASGFAAVRALFEAIDQEYATTDGGRLSEAIMRHLLMALLLRLGREAAGARPLDGMPSVQHETYGRFRQVLEREFARTRAVQDYAHELGCAPRTLNRAVLAIAGVPVKRFIDDRVTLEAKRLLAHTPLSVAEIAGRLGFSEPTNFVKFFRRGTGLIPGDFRERMSADADGDGRSV
jgi:AraC-like DNA-binding protein